jgi:hypothetical protein
VGTEAARLRVLLQQSAAFQEQNALIKRQADAEADLTRIFNEFLDERAARAQRHRDLQIEEERRSTDIFLQFLEERAARQERIDAHAEQQAREIGSLFNDAFKDFVAR